MMLLRVHSITFEAEGILSFELVDPHGHEVPSIQAGAHLDVKVPGTAITRRYSLCNPPWQRDHYRIAVLNVAGGRGGSRAMHENVRAGQLLEVTGPHNFFPLSGQSGRSLLLAGGIGVTPILAMAEQLERDGHEWEMHYCAQTPARTAFARRIQQRFAHRVHIHHDGGQPGKGLDIQGLLAQYQPDTHLYYCGPGGFMQAVQAAAAHWPKENLHFEYFGAEPAVALSSTGSETINNADGGKIILQRSQRHIRVEPEQTILQALREAGIEVESSCEAGVCGTCCVDYVSGEPVHNDFVLSDEERGKKVLVCCALTGAQPLVLDL